MNESRSNGKSLRYRGALLAGKAVAGALKIAHRSGGQLPGVVAEKICPDFLGHIGKPEHLVFVTGTNGKTTASNLLDDLFIGLGHQPLTNREGGNVNTGIMSSLLKPATAGGKQRNDLGVFELDELSCRKVLPYAPPEVLLITNLCRDSFNRNANTDYISSVISSSVPNSTKLVLNADDLISSGVAPSNHNRVYYSVGHLPDDLERPDGIVSDLTACPVCGGRLEYEWCHMRHLGKLHCVACGHGNPTPDYEVVSVDRSAGTMVVREHCHQGEEHEYRMVSASITGIYNLLSCITVLREMGYAADDIAGVLERGVRVTKLRHSEEEAGGIRLVNTASKGENSTATSIFFSGFRREPGRKALLLIIDDKPLEHNPYGSEYTGWHYQTDFEFLADPSIQQVVYYGPRGHDAMLRMELGGVDRSKVALATTFEQAVNLVDLTNVDEVCVAFDVYRAQDADLCRKMLRTRIEEGRLQAQPDEGATSVAFTPGTPVPTDVPANQGEGCVVEVLYPEFGNQAGENGNALYLHACLPGATFVETSYGDEPAFVTQDVSAIVMGGMTEAHQQLAAKALRPHAARLAQLADAGVPMLFTHSAAELLGTTFGTPDGGRAEGLGVLDFATRLDMPKRYQCSIVGTFDPADGTPAMTILGFKIQFTQMRGNNATSPFAKVERGWGLAEGSTFEGFRRGGLIASWIIGPLLAANPDFTSWFCKQVVGHDVPLAFEDEARAAYEVRFAELTKPLPKGKSVNP